jgi:hypothetical protein
MLPKKLIRLSPTLLPNLLPRLLLPARRAKISFRIFKMLILKSLPQSSQELLPLLPLKLSKQLVLVFLLPSLQFQGKLFSKQLVFLLLLFHSFILFISYSQPLVMPFEKRNITVSLLMLCWKDVLKPKK